MIEQLRELRDRYGHDVYAVVAKGPPDLPSTTIDWLRRDRIPYFEADFVFSFTEPRELIRAVKALRDLFRREKFDVVQSSVFWSMVVARPAAWLADVPVRLAMIAGPFHLQARASRIVERISHWMETALIPSAQISVDLCRELGVSASRLPLIYYGADAGRFDPKTVPAGIRAAHGWAEDTPIVALVAWFYHRLGSSPWIPPELHNRGVKGQEDFVKAAALVRAEFPQVKFLLVGGPFDAWSAKYMNHVRWLVTHLGLENTVIFTGFRTDVHAVLRDVNVAVQAPLNENLGGTIESLLMECPTVATRVGGLVDTIRDGETGVLVDPENPADLARGILELLRDPVRARTLARNGRKLILSRFSLDRTVDDLHALFVRLRAGQRRRFPNRWIALWRTAVAFPVFAYLKLRLAIEEARYRNSKMANMVPLYRDRNAIRGLHADGDILDADALGLALDGQLHAENGLFLGRGWSELESDSSGSFRWLGNGGGELVVTHPDGKSKKLLLEAESGPGQQSQPFEVVLTSETGQRLGSALVHGRRRLEFDLQLEKSDGALLRIQLPLGTHISSDPRILNLRVWKAAWELPLFRDLDALCELNRPADIVPAKGLAQLHDLRALPENGLFLGRGWHDLERSEQGPFRWLDSGGEIVVTRPNGCAEHLVLDIESGPGQHHRAFELVLANADGTPLQRMQISDRREITLRLPIDGSSGMVFRLLAPAGVVISPDERILNLRVHRIAWV